MLEKCKLCAWFLPTLESKAWTYKNRRVTRFQVCQIEFRSKNLKDRSLNLEAAENVGVFSGVFPAKTSRRHQQKCFKIPANSLKNALKAESAGVANLKLAGYPKKVPLNWVATMMGTGRHA